MKFCLQTEHTSSEALGQASQLETWQGMQDPLVLTVPGGQIHALFWELSTKGAKQAEHIYPG